MSKYEVPSNMSNIYSRGYLHADGIEYTDRALYLACIMHTTGDREGKEMQDILRFFGDVNLEG